MIKVNDSQEFKRLVRALSNDIVLANIHWRMRCDLLDAMTAYPLVPQQSNTFWYLTVEAHGIAAIHQLCRAFDKDRRSLHLLSWLLTIKENLPLFSPDEFKRRLASNAFVDSLAKGGTEPDEAQLLEDIGLCKVSDPLVKKLVAVRNTSLAHRSATLARDGTGLPAYKVLSVPEFEELLARATVILNRYTQLFAAESYSTTIIGAGDYEFIFKTVQAEVETSRARIEELLKRTQDHDANI